MKKKQRKESILVRAAKFAVPPLLVVGMTVVVVRNTGRDTTGVEEKEGTAVGPKRVSLSKESVAPKERQALPVQNEEPQPSEEQSSSVVAESEEESYMMANARELIAEVQALKLETLGSAELAQLKEEVSSVLGSVSEAAFANGLKGGNMVTRVMEEPVSYVEVKKLVEELTGTPYEVGFVGRNPYPDNTVEVDIVWYSHNEHPELYRLREQYYGISRALRHSRKTAQKHQ